MTPLDRVVPTAARLPAGWHRQQLVRLRGEGWAKVLEAPWDDGARDCLALWARRGLPLVVTRQPPAQGDVLATGLPAPASHGRRRLAVAVAPRDVLLLDEFPDAEAAAPTLPPAAAPAWRALVAALAAHGCAARVYGGFGWQALTGMAYVHAESDLDLLLPVETAAQADAIARLLALSEGVRSCLLPPARVASSCELVDGGQMSEGVRSCLLPPARVASSCELVNGGQKARPDPRLMWNGPRLDGELLFADGAAVAWREWLAYRQGRAAQVLVKRLHGVALEHFAADPA